MKQYIICTMHKGKTANEEMHLLQISSYQSC